MWKMIYFLYSIVLYFRLCETLDSDESPEMPTGTDFTALYENIQNLFRSILENGSVPVLDQKVIEETFSEMHQNRTLSTDAPFNSTELENATIPVTQCAEGMILPVKGTGEEVNHSLKILLMMFVIAVCFLEIYFLLRSNFHYLPESTIVVFTGAAFSGFFHLISGHLPGDFVRKEAFNPTTFFLFLLPPIMYESAYNLHKGNFFRNIGSILVFAIIGTAVSAFVIGGSLYFLGQKKIVYKLTFAESFAFGSFLSAVDPVATIAVFQALDVEPVLKMLVIGESILNDAVAIVLSTSVWEASLKNTAVDVTISYTVLQCSLIFASIFCSSALIGVSSGLFSALLFKHVQLRRYVSLEFGIMALLIYAPYCIAEVLQLSGIIAILFNGIVMSHYTHLNLSRLVQQIIQVTLRSIALLSETCVFAYLGVSIFSFKLDIEFRFIIASLLLCMAGRALTIFPLGFFVNFFRDHHITYKMLFIMWFSGIRGAVSYALALRFEFEEEKRNVIVTSTLIIVLVTTLFFGGSTMPLLKFLQKKETKTKREIAQSEVCLIKTEALGETVDCDQCLSDDGVPSLETQNIFVQVDLTYLIPFFTRKRKLLTGPKSDISEDFFKDWYKMVKNTSEDEE